tara:strand:+ start:1637 stop:1891 length:255 start_codon:yes stop_codon:yes gene_type:complete
MLNKLGHYIFKRICKEQELFSKKRPRNTYGLYITPRDIQRYVNDYMNYGIDFTGNDNVSAEDRYEYLINQSGKERYWDEADEDI